jgi:hypothetical protein
MALLIQEAASRSYSSDLLSYSKLWNWRSLWNITEVEKRELCIGSRSWPRQFSPYCGIYVFRVQWQLQVRTWIQSKRN